VTRVCTICRWWKN